MFLADEGAEGNHEPLEPSSNQKEAPGTECQRSGGGTCSLRRRPSEHKAKLSGEFCGNYVVDQVMEWNSPLSFPPSPRIDIKGRAGGEVCLHHLYTIFSSCKTWQRTATQRDDVTCQVVSDGEVACSRLLPAADTGQPRGG